MTDSSMETKEKQGLVLKANYKFVSEFGKRPAEFLDVGFGAPSDGARAGCADPTRLPGLHREHPW